jgi:hypothetical protein
MQKEAGLIRLEDFHKGLLVTRLTLFASKLDE